MKRHKLLHSNSKPFRCPECGLTFRDNGNMLKHLRKCRRKTHKNKQDGTATDSAASTATTTTSTTEASIATTNMSSSVTMATTSTSVATGSAPITSSLPTTASFDAVTQNAESFLSSLYPQGQGGVAMDMATPLPSGAEGHGDMEDMSIDRFALQLLSSIHDSDGPHDSFIGDLVPPASGLVPPLATNQGQHLTAGSAPTVDDSASLADDLLGNIITTSVPPQPFTVSSNVSDSTALYTTAVTTASALLSTEESMLNLLDTSVSSMDTTDNDLDVSHTTDNMADTSHATTGLADTSHTSDSVMDTSHTTSETPNTSVTEQVPALSSTSYSSKLEESCDRSEVPSHPAEPEGPRDGEHESDLTRISVSELDSSVCSSVVSEPLKHDTTDATTHEELNTTHSGDDSFEKPETSNTTVRESSVQVADKPDQSQAGLETAEVAGDSESSQTLHTGSKIPDTDLSDSQDSTPIAAESLNKDSDSSSFGPVDSQTSHDPESSQECQTSDSQQPESNITPTEDSETDQTHVCEELHPSSLTTVPSTDTDSTQLLPLTGTGHTDKPQTHANKEEPNQSRQHMESVNSDVGDDVTEDSVTTEVTSEVRDTSVDAGDDVTENDLSGDVTKDQEESQSVEDQNDSDKNDVTLVGKCDVSECHQQEPEVSPIDPESTSMTEDSRDTADIDTESGDKTLVKSSDHSDIVTSSGPDDSLDVPCPSVDSPKATCPAAVSGDIPDSPSSTKVNDNSDSAEEQMDVTLTNSVDSQVTSQVKSPSPTEEPTTQTPKPADTDTLSGDAVSGDAVSGDVVSRDGVDVSSPATPQSESDPPCQPQSPPQSEHLPTATSPDVRQETDVSVEPAIETTAPESPGVGGEVVTDTSHQVTTDSRHSHHDDSRHSHHDDSTGQDDTDNAQLPMDMTSSDPSDSQQSDTNVPVSMDTDELPECVPMETDSCDDNVGKTVGKEIEGMCKSQEVESDSCKEEDTENTHSNIGEVSATQSTTPTTQSRLQSAMATTENPMSSTDKDQNTQVKDQANFETDEPCKSKTEEQLKSDTEEQSTEEHSISETEEQFKSKTKEQLKLEIEEPSKSDMDDQSKSEAEAQSQSETEELSKSETEELSKSETEELSKSETEELSKSETEELSKSETEEVSKSETEEQTKTNAQTEEESETGSGTQATTEAGDKTDNVCDEKVASDIEGVTSAVDDQSTPAESSDIPCDSVTGESSVTSSVGQPVSTGNKAPEEDVCEPQTPSPSSPSPPPVVGGGLMGLVPYGDSPQSSDCDEECGDTNPSTTMTANSNRSGKTGDS